MKSRILVKLSWIVLGSALYAQTPVINAVADLAAHNGASLRQSPASLIGLFGKSPGAGGLETTVSFPGVRPRTDGTYQVNNVLPSITSVVNAASWNPQTLPNGGIALGAMLTIVGTRLGPATPATGPNPFAGTSLLGTSVSVTVNGTTVGVLMYYTSAGQVSGLLPSNTPVGAGTATITYNGASSAPFPLTVVESSAGIFTTPSNGSGAAVVMFPNYSIVSALPVPGCGAPNSLCDAANPKDTLILWLTGLRPVNAPDNSGPQPGNMDRRPLKVFIGGIEAPVSYRGRSGCCIGIDQVVFTVPDGVPTGCAVPMYIHIDKQISNVLLPVADGSRSCTPANPAITPDAVAAIAGTGLYTSMQVKLRRRPANNAQTNIDSVDAQLQELHGTPGWVRFFRLSLMRNRRGPAMS